MKHSFSDSLARAEKAMLQALVHDREFSNRYWPEHRPRILRILESVSDCLTGSPDITPRVLDLGCSNGFLCVLCQELGAEVTGADAYAEGQRESLFRERGIQERRINLNQDDALAEVESGAWDIVFLSEVFEHILQHPLGLLREIHRVLKPGGVLVLTTPNPSTLANAIRVLQDRHYLWGAREFLRQPKYRDGQILDRGDIHYQEYPASLVREVMQEAGFEGMECQNIAAGTSPSQPAWKRTLKGLLKLCGLGNHRWVSVAYLVKGIKPANPGVERRD